MRQGLRIVALTCAVLLALPPNALAQTTRIKFTPPAKAGQSAPSKTEKQDPFAVAQQGADEGWPGWLILGVVTLTGGAGIALWANQKIDYSDPPDVRADYERDEKIGLGLAVAGLGIILGGMVWKGLPERAWITRPRSGGVAAGGKVRWGGKR